MSTSDPENLHRLFAERANAGDIDGLLALYEDGAAFVGPDGVHASGIAAIRGRLEGLLALSPHITPIGSETVLAGETALIWNRWRMTFGKDHEQAADTGQASFEGTSTEVARRQADGGWRYL